MEVKTNKFPKPLCLIDLEKAEQIIAANLCEFIDFPVCECNSECSSEICTEDYSLTCQWAIERRKVMNEEKEKLYEFYVAGVQHHQLKTCIKEVQVGDELMLVPEPKNKYDPNAIKLLFPSTFSDAEETDPVLIMVGYVPASKGEYSAKVSAEMIIRDLKCIVTEINPLAKPWEQLKVAIMEA